METCGRRLKLNMEKINIMVIESSEDEPIQSGWYPCAVYGSGVAVNCILITQCGKWCLKRCSGIQRIAAQVADVFDCHRCSRGPAALSEAPLTIGDEEVNLADHFCYMGDMLSCE